MDDKKKYTDQELKAAYFLGITLEKQCNTEINFINLAAIDLPTIKVQQILAPMIEKQFNKTTVLAKALDKKINENINRSSKINN